MSVAKFLRMLDWTKIFYLIKLKLYTVFCIQYSVSSLYTYVYVHMRMRMYAYVYVYACIIYNISHFIIAQVPAYVKYLRENFSSCQFQLIRIFQLRSSLCSFSSFSVPAFPACGALDAQAPRPCQGFDKNFNRMRQGVHKNTGYCILYTFGCTRTFYLSSKKLGVEHLNIGFDF